MSFIVSHYNKLHKALESYIDIGGEGSMMSVKALWDTGSSQSCISYEIIKMIDPRRISKAKIASAEKTIVEEIFAISVALSDEIVFRDIAVKAADLSEKNTDMLIGMDIISRGDFEVRNLYGMTQFAFRIPPKNEPINFE